MQATVVAASREARRAVPGRRLEPARLEQVAGERRPGRCAGRSGRSSPGRPSAARRRASAASRSASNSCAARTRGSPPEGRTSAAGSRDGSFSARLGNSLTPVRASFRVASRCARASHAAAIRSRDQPRVQRRGQPAGPLDLGEPVPGRLREGVGERLDVPGAPGRVEDAREVPLLDQQAGGVPGDPAGEGVGQAQRGVERLHGDDVGAAHARGEAGDRRAQHVDPRVALRRHHRRGDGVLPLRAAPRARRRWPRRPGPTAGGRRAARRWS